MGWGSLQKAWEMRIGELVRGPAEKEREKPVEGPADKDRETCRKPDG